MKYRLRLSIGVVFVAAFVLSSLSGLAQHEEIATPEFQQVWSRNDRPVQQLVVPRTWTWGPGANSPLMQEPYFEAPGGFRDVQYFDKSRMEMPWTAGGDSDSPWFITQGLLARELMTGQLQLGDTHYEQHAPSQRPVAGDPDDAHGPKYATMGGAMGHPARANGSTITEVITSDGTIFENPDLAIHGVTDHYFVPETDHNVASIFWAFMNSSGTVYENGAFVDGPLFESPFYAIGLPLTEAYWAWVKVGGVEQNVLVQCFERRCLTFAPDNPGGWEVESGNVGQHYYHWRYEEIDRSTAGVSFSVTPESETNEVGDTHELTVTVFDYDGTAKDGVPVTAKVISTTGADQEHLDVTMTGTSGDDGDGVTLLSYVGAEPGTDTIQVTVSGVLESQKVHKTWVTEIEDEDEEEEEEPPADDGPGDPFTISLEHDGSSTNTVGASHTVIATVEDEQGNDVEDGTTIEFEIDGPNFGESGSADTEDGVATFTYTGTVTGDDDVTATWGDVESNTVTKTWLAGEPAQFTLEHIEDVAEPEIETLSLLQDHIANGPIYLEPHSVVGTMLDEFDNPVPGVAIDFEIVGPNSAIVGVTELPGDQDNRGVTDDDGVVTFTYTGTTPGVDTINATLVDDGDLNASLEKIWLGLRISLAHDGDASNHTGLAHTVVATVEQNVHDTSDWIPYEGAVVEFEIDGDNSDASGVADPPANGTGFGQTNAQGEATFTYTGGNTGSDDITATIMVDFDTATPLDDTVTKTWFTWSISLSHDPTEDSTNQIDSEHTVVATVVDHNGAEVDGVEVSFSITGGPHAGDFADTGGSGDYDTGQVSFSYTGTSFGVDTIEAAITDSRAGDQGDSTTIEKTWVDVQFSFDPDNDSNPFFTQQEIDEIEALVVGELDDPDQGEIDQAIADFWTAQTGHPVPNRHSVEISVTENGDPVASGDLEVAVVYDQGGADEEEFHTDTLTITNGTATLTYDAHDQGIDTITAIYSANSGSTTKTWTPFLDTGYTQVATYVQLSVSDDNPTVDDDVTLSALVLDQYGQPVPNVDVRFDTDRESDPLGTESTGSNGEAAERTGHNHQVAEDEEITATEQASGNANSDSQTISWSAGAPTSVTLTVTPSTLTVGGTVTLSALVEDEYGNPVPNHAVEFVSSRTSPTPIDLVSTGSNGEPAVFFNYSVNESGDDEITAFVDVSISDTQTITWEPDEPDHVVLTVTPTDPTVGNDVVLSAVVYDQHNNPVPNVNVEFTTDRDPDNPLDTVSTGANGEAAEITDHSDTDAGDEEITVTEQQNSNSDSETITWETGDPVRVELTVTPSTQTVGNDVALSAIVYDTYDNPVPNYAVEFTSSRTGQNPIELRNTGPNGEPSVFYTYSQVVAGDDEITATITDTISDTQTITWEPDVADEIILEHDDTDTDVSTNPVNTEHSVTATVVDQYDNTVTDFTGNIVLYVDGTDDVDTEAAVAGVANLSYTGPTAPRADSLTAESGSLSSNTLTKHWVAGPADNIVLTHTDSDPENPVATEHSVTATVVDEFGNTVLTFDGNIEFFIDGNSQDTEQAAGGVATFVYTGPFEVGSDQITAESGDLTSNELTKTWVPGDAADIVLEHDGPSAGEVATNTVGTSHMVKAYVMDAYENVVTDYEGEIVLTNNNAADIIAEASDGVAAFTYTGPTTPRTDTLGAELVGDESVTEKFTLTKHWAAGDPDELVLSHTGDDFDDPETTATNVLGEDDDHTVYVRVHDEYGNPVADGTAITFTVTNDDGGAVVASGTETTTKGIASFDYDAPDDPATHSIVATWGDPVAETSNTLTKEWEDDSSEPTSGTASLFAGAADFTSDGTVCGASEWEDPDNALGEDEDFVDSAEANVPAGEVSACLELTEFGFELQNDAVIDGIEVTIWRSGHGEQIRDHNLQLMKSGARVGENRGDIDNVWSSSGHEWSYGATDDLWGTTWSAAEINDPDFGFSIAVTNVHNNATRPANVFGVQITVHYTIP